MKSAKPSSLAQERALETTARLVAIKRIAAKHGFDLNQRSAATDQLTRALLAVYEAGLKCQRSPRYEVVDHKHFPGTAWSIRDMKTGDISGFYGTRRSAKRDCDEMNFEWQGA